MFLSILIPFFFLIVGCEKQTINEPDPLTDPPPTPPVIKLIYTTNEYDAVYYPNEGTFIPYPYHVKQSLYFPEGRQFAWSTTVRNSNDTLFFAEGVSDSASGLDKGCIALVSSIDSSQQANNDHYIGSYYKFALFNDSAVGNLQFTIPADQFASVDSIPVQQNSMLVFKGGLNSFYKGMAKAEIKVAQDKNFVQLGDSLSYANPLCSARGTIDSAEVMIMVTRFSDNGFHPGPKITKTMDANYTLTFYFSNGARFVLINGKFTNLFFQKGVM